MPGRGTACAELQTPFSHLLQVHGGLVGSCFTSYAASAAAATAGSPWGCPASPATVCPVHPTPQQPEGTHPPGSEQKPVLLEAPRPSVLCLVPRPRPSPSPRSLGSSHPACSIRRRPPPLGLCTGCSPYLECCSLTAAWLLPSLLHGFSHLTLLSVTPCGPPALKSQPPPHFPVSSLLYLLALTSTHSSVEQYFPSVSCSCCLPSPAIRPMGTGRCVRHHRPWPDTEAPLRFC